MTLPAVGLGNGSSWLAMTKSGTIDTDNVSFSASAESFGLYRERIS
jgi:hypothetical protein